MSDEAPAKIAPLVRLVTDAPAVEPDADVVASLRDLLARAEAGAVRSFAAVTTDDEGAHVFAYVVQHSQFDVTLGALARLNAKLIASIADDDE